MKENKTMDIYIGIYIEKVFLYGLRVEYEYVYIHEYKSKYILQVG